MSRFSPSAHNFFALLQQVEHAHPDKPLLGTSLRLRDDPVRMGQYPHLDFATQDFKHDEIIQTGKNSAVRKLFIQNFGLLGPNGALPLHYTEHAHARIHHWNDPTFSEFLDIFHHRAYTLFYRAWAEAQPHIAHHRVAGNPFSKRLNCLVGHGPDSSWGREDLPAHFRAGLAAHFTRRSKTQEGLACALAACTGQPVHIHPFQAQWLNVSRPLKRAALGHGAMLGSRVWCAQSKIKIAIGAMPYADYLNLLPGAPGRARLVQATHAYLGLEFDCDYEFRIKPEQVPQARLNGAAQLGRTSWLGARRLTHPQQLPLNVRVACPSVPSPSSLSRSSA